MKIKQVLLLLCVVVVISGCAPATTNKSLYNQLVAQYSYDPAFDRTAFYRGYQGGLAQAKQEGADIPEETMQPLIQKMIEVESDSYQKGFWLGYSEGKGMARQDVRARQASCCAGGTLLIVAAVIAAPFILLAAIFG